MVKEKTILQDQGNVREFYSESGKIGILKKNQGKWKTDFVNQTDCESHLMPSNAGRNISDQMVAKDCYNQKLEGTTLSEIFVREI